MMRALVISEENKAKAARLVEFASKPQNFYQPGVTAFVPGDQPEFTTYFDEAIRCVFTITLFEGRQYRHLSMSVKPPGGLPNPTQACTIATWFGLTGAKINDGVATEPGSDWRVGVEDGRALVIVQPVPPS